MVMASAVKSQYVTLAVRPRAEEDAHGLATEEPRAGGGERKKMVSPEHQRQMAAFVVAGELCFGRTACRCLRLARSSFQYRQRPPTAERTRLVQRLHELSRKTPPPANPVS